MKTTQNGSIPDFSSLPGPDNIGRRVFSNGSVGLAWENWSSSSVFVYGWLWAGNVDERPEQAGLASLTASMLTRGTEHRTMLEISEEIESLGASIGIHSGGHTTAYTAKCLIEDLDRVLDVLTDCLYCPTFPPEQIERRRGQILTALEQRKHNTSAMANLRYYELMYPDHPYGRSAFGYQATIENLTREDVLAFYQARYSAQRGGVTLTGPLPSAQALDRLESALGTWQGAQCEPASIPTATPPDAVRQTYTPIPDKTQSDIYLGWLGFRRRDPDFIPAHLANCILGQFGMMGRLGKYVREQQGLAYYSYSALDAGLEPGTWTAIAGVAPENVERAQASILAEVRRIRTEPVSKSELADNQAYLIGSLPLRLEAKERVAYQIAHMELLELGLDYLRSYPSLVQAVTPDDILAVTRKYINPDQYVLSVAGPPAEATTHEE
jgi:zinc protease